MLRREDLTAERIDQWIAEARSHGFDWFISHEERTANLLDTLAGWVPGTDAWVFGYGSLMWNPAIKWTERRIVRLVGYRRSFCFWTPLGRGTPQFPGLMLALESGGECWGIAWRIAAEDVPEEFRILWNREMLSGVYRPEWVDVTDRDGNRLRAVTFVVEPQHRQYVGDLPLDTSARHIAFAQGRNGCCRDYLAETVLQLREMQISDGYIDALNALLDLAVFSNVNEGGTMIVPGHGRLCDKQDVIEYRDMATIVRDRIKEYVRRGMTLDQVKAAKPTLDFDPRYGTPNGFWTPDQFVEVIYKQMKQAQGPAAPPAKNQKGASKTPTKGNR